MSVDGVSSGTLSSDTTCFNYNTLPAGSHTITVSAENPNGTSTPSASVTVVSDGSGVDSNPPSSGSGTAADCNL